MNIGDYIQSGIIESYVLGLASAEEAVEIERLRKQYSEVDLAISEFSLLVEAMAFENAVAPPEDLKAKIFALVNGKDGMKDKKHQSSQVKEEALVVPAHSMRSWRMLAAASVILLIVSAALNYYLYNQYNEKKEAYQALLSDRQTLQANIEIYQTQLKEWQSAAVMMADTTMATVKMRSPKGKGDVATVFWNKQNKDVYVMVNKLPEPKTGKQYQLWAMVDGKPVDAGLLNPSCTSVCKMKNIPKAQAFAITLEKEGGSPAPNLKALYVMGAI